MAATPLILNQAVQQTHQVNLIIRQVGFETEFFKQEDCQIIGLRIGAADGRFHMVEWFAVESILQGNSAAIGE